MDSDFPHHTGTAPPLSLPDTLVTHLLWIRDGVIDACSWVSSIRMITSDAQLTAPVLKSFLLNTLALLSLHAADALLLRAGFGVRLFYHTIVSAPLLAVALYLNTNYCTQTAHRAFALQHGARALVADEITSPLGSGVLGQLATVAPRIAMLGMAVTLDAFLRIIPFIGPPMAFLYLCWVDAYYYFELAHIARGLPLARRALYLEERWAYHLGFGLPSAVLLTLGNSTPLSNAALFALSFPLYIVLATAAHPQPAARGDPPLDTLIPTRIPLFTPILWADSVASALIAFASSRFAGSDVGMGPRKGNYGGLPNNGIYHSNPAVNAYGVASGYGRTPYATTGDVHGRRSFGDDAYGSARMPPPPPPQAESYAPGKAAYSMGRYAGTFGEGWNATSARKYE